MEVPPAPACQRSRPILENWDVLPPTLQLDSVSSSLSRTARRSIDRSTDEGAIGWIAAGAALTFRWEMEAAAAEALLKRFD